MSELYRLCTMGYYDKNALAAVILVYVMFDLMKIQLFVFLAAFPLEMNLKTQVLRNGRVLLLAYD